MTDLLTQQDKIFPWLMPSTAAKAVADGIPAQLPWLGELAVYYVIRDDDHQQQLIKESDLSGSLSLAQLHRIAVTNLDNKVIFDLKDADFGGYTMDAGANHVANALCLNRLWVWLTNHFEDDLIVAIPRADQVLFTPASDTEKVLALKACVAQVEDEALFTRQLFRYGRDGLWQVVA